jgi:hypothetical protein
MLTLSRSSTVSILAVLLACFVAAPVRAAACPSAKFETFIAKFAESGATQKAFTQLPLSFNRLDKDVEPEPRLLESTVMVIPARYYMLLAQQRRGQGKLQRTATVASDRATLVLSGSDSDEKVEYDFRFANGCWKLERIADLSL